MSAELATWRPLYEFAMVLVVLGLAGCLKARERISWWLSQGLVTLGVIVGMASTGAMHQKVDLFSLGIWLPLVAVVELSICVLSHNSVKPSETTKIST